MIPILYSLLSLLSGLWLCIMVIKYQEIAQKGLNWQIGFWVAFWVSINLWAWF